MKCLVFNVYVIAYKLYINIIIPKEFFESIVKILFNMLRYPNLIYCIICNLGKQRHPKKK